LRSVIEHGGDPSALGERQKIRPLENLKWWDIDRVVNSQEKVFKQRYRIFKRFKIVTDQYRNRRKKFGLRFNFTCAICDFDLQT
jgi:hypothetical protein